MGGNTINDLLKEDIRLLAEEQWLQETLAKIKHQKMAIEVEKLQLLSLLRTLLKELQEEATEKNKDPNVTENVNVKVPETQHPRVDAELLDQAKSSVNTKTLDLSIVNHFNDMLNSLESEDETD